MEALPHTDPCQAMDVIPNDACISFDTYYSIFEYDLPNCDFSNQKIWYQFYTGTDLNEIKIELEKIGDQENVFLGLGYFQGNWCENQFHWVDTYCGDVSGASFSAEELMPYQLYHIVVGTNFGFTGQFDLCIDGEYNSPYTNGTPCSAFNIDNLSGCIGGNSEFAGLAEQDTICYDISPVTKNWYKVDLERFDGEISVDFTALSNIPVHNIELGFFNNGCLDSFIIVNDYCGVDQVSNTVFEFADSIDYAYISVNLPNDQDYNFSICVNKLDLVENCIMNDFCSEAIDEGLVSMEQDICFTSCTFGSTQENTDEYYTSHFNTNWHKFTTADEVYELEITFQNQRS